MPPRATRRTSFGPVVNRGPPDLEPGGHGFDGYAFPAVTEPTNDPPDGVSDTSSNVIQPIRMQEGSSLGDTEEVDLSISRSTMTILTETVYQVLFLMVVGNDQSSSLISYLSILIEDIQLLTYFFSDIAGQFYYVPSHTVAIISEQYDNLTIGQFNMFFSVACTACLLMVANCGYVAWGAMSRPRSFLKLVTLKTMVLDGRPIDLLILPTILYTPIFNIFLTSFSCPWQTLSVDDPSAVFISQMGCLNPQRFVYMSLSFISCILFVPTAWTMGCVYLDMNPVMKGDRNKSHGRMDFCYAMLKTVLILVWRFVPIGFIQLGAVLIMSSWMFYTILLFHPYFHARFNQFRAGIFCSSIIVGLISVFGAGLSTFSSIILPGYFYFILLGALVPGFVIGWLYCMHSAKKISLDCRQSLNTMNASVLTSTVEDDNIIVFQYWTHVEITARSLIEELNNRRRRIDLDKFQEISRIFKRGIKEFPDEPYVRLQYATYMFHLTMAKREAIRGMKRIKMMQPAFDVLCQVHFLTQIGQQDVESQFLGSGVKLNVTRFAEFQKTFKKALQNHNKSVLTMLEFWKSVSNSKSTPVDLQALGMHLYHASQKADEAYTELIGRFPKNQQFLRMYGKFCFDVLNDNERGRMLTDQADVLESEEASAWDQEATDFRDSPNDRPNLRSPSVGPTANPRMSVAVDDRKFTKATSSHGSSHMSEHKNQSEKLQLKASLITQRGKDSRILFQSSTALGLISLVICIVNFVLSTAALSNTALGLSVLQSLHHKERYSASLVYRVRRLQAYYQANDSISFQNEQLTLQAEMDILNSELHNLLASSDSDPATYAWYTVPSIPANMSAYPGLQTRYTQLVTGYELTEKLVLAGFRLSYMNMNDFRNITYDNSFRYIMDNYQYIHVYSDYVMNYLFFLSTSAASNTIIILACVQCISIIILIIVLDVRIMITRKQQGKLMAFFKKIPSKLIKDHIEKIEIEIEEDVGGLGLVKSHINHQRANREEFLFTKWGLRLQYTIYLFLLCSLSAYNASINNQVCAALDYFATSDHLAMFYRSTITTVVRAYGLDQLTFACPVMDNTIDPCLQGLYSIGVEFAVADQLGDLITFDYEIFQATKELVIQDMMTWGTPQNLRSYFNDRYANLDYVRNALVYGDNTRYPPTENIENYPEPILGYITNTSCLPLNQTLCSTRVWNTSIGYTPGLMNRGLQNLLDQGLIQYQVIGEALNGQVLFAPSPQTIALLSEILDPDLVDGLTRAEVYEYSQTATIVNTFVSQTKYVLAAQICLIIFGQFSVMLRITNRFYRMQMCVIDLIIRLPEGIRRDPYVIELIQNELRSGHEKKSRNDWTTRLRAVPGTISRLLSGRAAAQSKADPTEAPASPKGTLAFGRLSSHKPSALKVEVLTKSKMVKSASNNSISTTDKEGAKGVAMRSKEI
ncbi:uncharacterized protein BJ171DRAFT_570053 [Polychytrium aggregatum]|uniref:uncharacterized protein n=1 Tax=Polychytrium aggregatum TaxID=110093 RepID=UPI0022FEC93C|nr:uncharacterized protein BJ171DRAFT_570053 [Polychytrium aggregatum]KAI9202020.1 hypothetical protein BJ171DRAFT_570053 [Polychytrium aggregatum]